MAPEAKAKRGAVRRVYNVARHPSIQKGVLKSMRKQALVPLCSPLSLCFTNRSKHCDHGRASSEQDSPTEQAGLAGMHNEDEEVCDETYGESGESDSS